MNEVTIDLSDLFRKLKRKWKLIVCFALVCALIAGGYGYKRALQAENAAQERHDRYAAAASDLPGYFNEDLYALREDLSENAAAFAEAFAGIYRGFLEQYWHASGEVNHLENAESYMMFLDAYKDVISVMGGTQREYYEGLITAVTENGTREHAEVTPYEASSPSVIQPKWIVVGLVLGTFLACGCVVLPYLMTKKLRTEKDLEYSFGIPVLGVLDGKDGESLKQFASQIRLLARNRGADTVLLWGSGDRLSSDIRNQLKENLQKTGFRGAECYDEVPESERMGKLADAKAVVLVEKTGKSRYEDIHREAELCRMLDVPLLGSIVSE